MEYNFNNNDINQLISTLHIHTLLVVIVIIIQKKKIKKNIIKYHVLFFSMFCSSNIIFAAWRMVFGAAFVTLCS